MPDSSSATRSSVIATAERLTGSRLSAVTYVGFSFWGEDWDHGRYHDASMGVELCTDSGDRFVACWGDAFGHFGLELLHDEAAEVFQNAPESRDFSAHRWWAPFAQHPLGARISWSAEHADSPDPAPVAIVLESAPHSVWIAAAERDESAPLSKGGFLLGMDSVIVTGDVEFARAIGLG